MKEIDLSDLAGIWFHDVKITRIGIDYIRHEVELDYIIPVGFWNTPNRDGLTDGEKKGTLVLTGLLYLSMEPPDERYPYHDGEGVEVTDAGCVTPEQFEEYLVKMPKNLPDEAFLHYFYVADWNNFIFAAATGASFREQ